MIPMEEKAKARAPRKAGTKGPSSSHVIDLRQAGGTVVATKPSKRVVAKPAPRKPASPAPPKPVATPKPEPKEAVAPIEEPFVMPEATSNDFLDTAPAPKRRFWPAFWRFLLLLILFGALLTGSVYVYLNYLQG